MIYEYSCKKCNSLFIVHKESKHADRGEKCPNCKVVAERVYTPSMIKTNDGTKFGGTK